ncbi:MAG: hypothetical protein ACI8WB_005644 [Phenylobacterium sp.]
MKNPLTTKQLLSVGLLSVLLSTNVQAKTSKGTPDFKAMSELAISPQGVLFIGDSHKGAITAIDFHESAVGSKIKPPEIANLKAQIAALLGTKKTMVQVNDMAVNPVSKNTYIIVTRGKAKSKNTTPVLVRVKPDSSLEVVDLSNVNYDTANIPNLVNASKKHRNGTRAC